MSITVKDMAEIILESSKAADQSEWVQYAKDVKADRKLVASFPTQFDAISAAREHNYAPEVAADYLRLLSEFNKTELKDPLYDPPEIGQLVLVYDKSSDAIGTGFIKNVVDDKEKRRLNWKVFSMDRIYEVSLWAPLPGMGDTKS